MNTIISIHLRWALTLHITALNFIDKYDRSKRHYYGLNHSSESIEYPCDTMLEYNIRLQIYIRCIYESAFYFIFIWIHSILIIWKRNLAFVHIINEKKYISQNESNISMFKSRVCWIYDKNFRCFDSIEIKTKQ